MLYLIAHVQVSFGENYEKKLSSVVRVSVNDSIDGIGARCEITCPLNARIEKDGGTPFIAPVRTAFKTGDKVRVKAWYDDYRERTLFEGYVYQIREGTPSTIVCEDQVYLLRRGILNKVWNKPVKLKEILQYVCSSQGVEVSDDVADVEFIKFSIKDSSPLYVLQQIKSEMWLVVTFRDKKLVATGISATKGNNVKLASDRNVIGCNIQQPDGVWKQFKLKVEYTDNNGKKKSFTVGDQEGQIRVVDCTSVTKENAESFVNTHVLDNLRTGMYEGTLTTLLYPEVKLFSLVDYEDKSFSSLNGTYKVKRVGVTIDTQGCRQTLTLAQIASDMPVPQTTLSNG